MKPQIKFGTEGWRGVIADDFTVANVRLVTRAIGNHIKTTNPPGSGIVIGFDCRSQSEIFAAAAAEVLVSLGFPVTVADRPTSSPATVSAIVRYGMQGGIIFTASHNPGAFHGIKFKPYYGGSAFNEITDEIEDEIAPLLQDYERWGDRPKDIGTWKTEDLTPGYLKSMESLIDLQAIRNAGFNIVFDAMHGAGAGYLGSIVGPVIAIREERNPLFGGINPEPIPKNLGLCFDAVKSHHADIGIAVDGDADRVGAVDEMGEFMDSHRIYAILLKHLVERHGWRGSVVKTVSTSRMIDKLAALYGLTVHVTPIGFKYICQWMVDEEVLIGGEESGGIGIPKHLKERDGIFSGLLLLEAMALSGKTASGLVREIFDMVGEHYYSREDLHFTREEMPFVQESLKKIKPERIGDTFVQHIETMDGTRFDFENGWLLLRASGTEPVVRVYSESTDQSQPTKWITSGEALIRDAIRNG